MKLFHEKTDENIIQDNADQYEQEIPEELYAPVKYGSWKDYMSHQHKAGWKADKKGYDKCGYMWFERNESQM